MKNIVVLTGAGVSAESGISTFRDAGGLWENHHVQDVASPEGWRRNRELVLRFYNERRKQLFDVKPNDAHEAIADLETKFRVQVVTQNIDDLHERAGSTQMVHLHGELRKSRSSLDENLVYQCIADIRIGDKCEKGSQLRPHIVWFGEAVPLISFAAHLVSEADLILVVGSSMQVYPAAGLVGYAKRGVSVIYIDPKPAVNHELKKSNLTILPMKATEGVRKVVTKLLALPENSSLKFSKEDFSN
jgi:NAD-dependent deacetylase